MRRCDVRAADWSLSYINYPLLLLAKSCKLVPVMLVGVVMLGRRHTRAEYLAVALITAGVALFSLKPEAFQEAALDKEGGGEAQGGGSNNLLGLALVREEKERQKQTGAQTGRLTDKRQRERERWVNASLILRWSRLKSGLN